MTYVPALDHVDYNTHRASDIGEWFLLREDVQGDGTVYRAGTPVMRAGDQWFVCGAETPVPWSFDGRVCRTEYGGLSLHVVSCDIAGSLSHRRIGSNEPAEVIPSSRVLSPPEHGRDRVYLAFGDQFYPLEYFGW